MKTQLLGNSDMRNNSLRRLNTDVIDLHQIQWPADDLPGTRDQGIGAEELAETAG